MSKRIVVDPLTRIEGHLRFETIMDGSRVADARCSSEMFRGLEAGLIGRDARTATQITQRVCGVCPYAHAEAAASALEAAMGITPNRNGQIMRNLIKAAYGAQDQILHFYILSALDFIDVTAILSYQGRDAGMIGLQGWVSAELSSNKIRPASPFLPRYQGAYATDKDLNLTAIKNYLAALPQMAKLHKMVAIFGGKAPHAVSVEAGGVTVTPSLEQISQYGSLLDEAELFIRNRYLQDVLAVAKAFPSYFHEGKGYGNLLSYPSDPDPITGKPRYAGGVSIDGKYEPLSVQAIAEDHQYSFYSNKPDQGVKPLQGSNLKPLSFDAYQEEHGKANGKYSWTRSPRYAGMPMEVGPVARVVNTYRAGTNPTITALVDSMNAELGIGLEQYNSVMGRHLCRVIGTVHDIEQARHDLALLTPGISGFVEQDVPRNAQGFGLTEASRGALGHWIATDEDGLIRRYEMIVPTTWNIGPRDASGQPGPVEKMLIGTDVADPKNPLELARIIRSTDPCMACSVH